jgi:hypothetical protein
MKTEIKQLRDLVPGDYFYSKSDKKYKTKYKVSGLPEFNIRAGSATRKCINLKEMSYEDKLCRSEVVRIIPVAYPPSNCLPE